MDRIATTVVRSRTRRMVATGVARVISPAGSDDGRKAATTPNRGASGANASSAATPARGDMASASRGTASTRRRATTAAPARAGLPTVDRAHTLSKRAFGPGRSTSSAMRAHIRCCRWVASAPAPAARTWRQRAQEIRCASTEAACVLLTDPSRNAASCEVATCHSVMPAPPSSGAWPASSVS
jgi:hypothetical protein